MRRRAGTRDGVEAVDVSEDQVAMTAVSLSITETSHISRAVADICRARRHTPRRDRAALTDTRRAVDTRDRLAAP